ncbi:hypothetical protein PENTCL1PPCAC_11212, partial [Pristionchus entomophagus]
QVQSVSFSLSVSSSVCLSYCKSLIDSPLMIATSVIYISINWLPYPYRRGFLLLAGSHFSPLIIIKIDRLERSTVSRVSSLPSMQYSDQEEPPSYRTQHDEVT